MDVENVEFGKYLKKIREEKRLSIRKLADMAGVSSSYLSQLENSRRNPPKPDLLRNLAFAMSFLDDQEFKDLYKNFMIYSGYAPADTLDVREPTNQSNLTKNDFLISYMLEDNKRLEIFGKAKSLESLFDLDFLLKDELFMQATETSDTVVDFMYNLNLYYKGKKLSSKEKEALRNILELLND